jgi:hypothetical protein
VVWFIEDVHERVDVPFFLVADDRAIGALEVEKGAVDFPVGVFWDFEEGEGDVGVEAGSDDQALTWTVGAGEEFDG